MIHALKLEDNDALRIREGIDNVALREEVGSLAMGDCVRLTFLGGIGPPEKLMVRICRVHGSEFRGQLLQRPAFIGGSGPRAGAIVRFRAVHIHSIVRLPTASELPTGSED